MRNILLLALLLGASAAPLTARAADTSFARIERGRALTTAGDCVACHTTDEGKPFAGGRPIETPFGVIYSPNLTPDRETGIGAWTDDQFYTAMHEGLGPSERHLYPAFPYPYFTKVTRDDVLAIRAYLSTLPPVRSARKKSKLPWPLDQRFLLTGWNELFFEQGTYRPNAGKSAEWNRGAYLVEGLGHCGGCHTAKNFLGGDKTGSRLEGGSLQGWFAPNITGEARTGLGSWSAEDIVDYLKNGRNTHSGATGLMAEVVTDSTSKLDPSDLHAMAVYLKDVPGHPLGVVPAKDGQVNTVGRAIYADSCSACHQADGHGVPQMFSPLAGSALLQSADPTTLIRIVLEGARTASTDRRPTTAEMPAYGWKLSDSQIAAVLTYVRNNWGNTASDVTAAQIHSVRERLGRERDH